MSKETVIRTLILLLALINQVLYIFGVNPIPIENEMISQLITAFFTVGASIWAWWKNNSFTVEAQEADKFLKELKRYGY